MYKFILLLALASSNAVASNNILPETKSARRPASDSPPPIEGPRQIIPNRTYEVTATCGAHPGHIRASVKIPNVRCTEGLEFHHANIVGGGFAGTGTGTVYYAFRDHPDQAAARDCFITGKQAFPAINRIGFQAFFSPIPDSCYGTISEADSIRQYVDHQIKVKLDEYLKAIDQKISERFEQKIKDKKVQDHLQMEAVRILEANAALRNQ
jgi:hypothetical protein